MSQTLPTTSAPQYPFQGPCFGDITPPESTPAAPSPSPLPPASTNQAAPHTEDLIDLTAVPQEKIDYAPSSPVDNASDLSNDTGRIDAQSPTPAVESFTFPPTSSTDSPFTCLLLDHTIPIDATDGPSKSVSHQDDLPDALSYDMISTVPNSDSFSVVEEPSLLEVTESLLETRTDPMPRDQMETSTDISSLTLPLTPVAHPGSPSNHNTYPAFSPSSLVPSESNYLMPSSSIPATIAATSISLPDDICSSPPSSSPEAVFSSSPLIASDSSVCPQDPQSPNKTELHPPVSVVDSDPMLPASSQLSSSMQDDQHCDELSLSSSPLPTSSPIPPSSSPSYPPADDHPQPEAACVAVPSQESSSLPSAEHSSPPKLDHVLQTAPSVLLLTCQGQKPLETTSSEPVEAPDANLLTTQSEGISQIDVSPVDLTLDKSKDAEPSKKRKAEEEAGTSDAGEMKTAQPPNPKRPTLQSQQQQRMTLIKPFRSPAMIIKLKASEPQPQPPSKPAEASIELPRINDDPKKKHRTQRAAGQFKSPLSVTVSASLPSSVRQTPTIQTLESKVQVLKRAIKIKKEGEEETLEGLVKKWTEAGREVAWEVWGLVKDNETSGGDDWGKSESGSAKRRFEDSWGWSEDSGGKRVKTEEAGWDESSSTTGQDAEHATEQSGEAMEEEKPKETMGTMLLRLGIAPWTLGWNEEDGEFSDAY